MRAETLRELAREAPLRVTIAGGCMTPGIADGTTLEVAPARVYWPGDVIVFRRADGRLVAHRVIGFRPGKWLFTQADASTAPDSVVNPADILGRGLLKVSVVDRVKALAAFARLAASRLRARFA
jgi:phage repressor protein C with HTH and peptisase S24 domain